MRRIALLLALLSIIAVSRCQEEKVRYAEVEETSVVVVFPGMPELDDKSFDTSLPDIALSNDDSINRVHILGRRFGPFDGPAQDNFEFGTQLWSMLTLLTSRLEALDDFQSQIAAAMALRCPRMRQRALDNILFNQQYTGILSQASSTGEFEPGFIGTASNGGFSIDDSISSSSTSSSSKGRWFPGIADDDITVEEPQFWDRFNNNNIDNEINSYSHSNNNDEDDVFYFDFEADDDPPKDMEPLPMPMPYPPHHHHVHHHEYHHDHNHQEHDHEHHFHHHDNEEERRPGPGWKTKPLFIKPFHSQSSSSSSSSQSRENWHQLPDIIFSATISTDFFDEDDGDSLEFNGFRNREEEEGFVNWELWNDDGSLNTGLLVFVVLCAACAVVWSALLMQCARMSYSWVACCDDTSTSSYKRGGDNQGQFIFLSSLESESDDESEDDDEEESWKSKTGKKGYNDVVIAAEYTTIPTSKAGK